MFILQLVLILGPGIIAARIYEGRTMRADTPWNILYDVSKFTLAIFWLTNLAQFLRGWGDTFTWTVFTVQFIVKYIVFATILVILLPFGNAFLDKRKK